MFNEAFASTLPLQGSDIAGKWDNLYNFLLWLSIFFFVVILIAMVYFAVKYRHQSGHKPKYLTGNMTLEVVWTIIPTILLMIIFGWGYSVYHDMTQAPPDAYEIRVIGKQWLWQFQYDDGRMTTGELYVPLNRPVKLIMTSEDVIHSFFVPNFRIKQDVVPGMYTSVWFEATVPGKHQVFCAEYCGTAHSGMLAKVIVLEPTQWEAWKQGKQLGAIPEAGQEVAKTDQLQMTQASVRTSLPARSLVAQGKKIFETKGCVSCHTTDGVSRIGPSLKGLYGSNVQLADNSVVKADENYIRESIENPQAKIVKGFNPVMPTFKGTIAEAEMNALIAYIKNLK